MRLLKSNAIEAIHADTTISDTLDTRALDLTIRWTVLDGQCTRIRATLAGEAGRLSNNQDFARQQYPLAERYVKATFNLIWNNCPTLNALGIAQYRQATLRKL